MTGYYLGADVRADLLRYVTDVHAEIGAGMDATTARVNRAKLHHVLAMLDTLPERAAMIDHGTVTDAPPDPDVADRIEERAQAASFNQGDEPAEDDDA